MRAVEAWAADTWRLLKIVVPPLVVSTFLAGTVGQLYDDTNEVVARASSVLVGGVGMLGAAG